MAQHPLPIMTTRCRQLLSTRSASRARHRTLDGNVNFIPDELNTLGSLIFLKAFKIQQLIYSINALFSKIVEN
jgi:hypothetical protein